MFALLVSADFEDEGVDCLPPVPGWPRHGCSCKLHCLCVCACVSALVFMSMFLSVLPRVSSPG